MSDYRLYVGDRVSFPRGGQRLTGTIVHIYRPRGGEVGYEVAHRSFGDVPQLFFREQLRRVIKGERSRRAGVDGRRYNGRKGVAA